MADETRLDTESTPCAVSSSRKSSITSWSPLGDITKAQRAKMKVASVLRNGNGRRSFSKIEDAGQARPVAAMVDDTVRHGGQKEVGPGVLPHPYLGST